MFQAKENNVCPICLKFYDEHTKDQLDECKEEFTKFEEEFPFH